MSFNCQNIKTFRDGQRVHAVLDSLCLIENICIFGIPIFKWLCLTNLKRLSLSASYFLQETRKCSSSSITLHTEAKAIFSRNSDYRTLINFSKTDI
jgi:hypothetical protein